MKHEVKRLLLLVCVSGNVIGTLYKYLPEA